MSRRRLFTGLTFINWGLAALVVVVMGWRAFWAAEASGQVHLWLPIAAVGLGICYVLLRERVTLVDDGVEIVNGLQRKRCVDWSEVAEVGIQWEGATRLGGVGLLRLTSGDEVVMSQLRLGGSRENPRSAPLVENAIYLLDEALHRSRDEPEWT